MDEDWNKIIAQGETMRLDFKGPMAWDKTTRGALAEDIVGMANIRDGGTILIGISERSDGSHVIQGMSEDEISTFEITRISDFVASHFQPAVSLRVERITLDQKQLIAIRVHEFDQTPVVCTKDGPVKDDKGKRYYYEGNLIVRTVAAKTVVVRTAEDMQALIRLAITKTSNLLLEDFRRILEGRHEPSSEKRPDDVEFDAWMETFANEVAEWKGSYPNHGFFAFYLVPDSSTSESLDHLALKRLVQSAHVNLRDLDLPGCYPNQTTTVQNLPNGIQGRVDIPAYEEIWQLHKSGTFTYGRLLLYRQSSRGLIFIPFEQIIILVALAVQFAQRLYQNISPTGQIAYRFSLGGVKGQQLGVWSQYPLDVERFLGLERRAAIEPVEASGSVSVLDLRSAWRSVARDVATKLLTIFNWDRPEVAVDAQLDKI